MEPRTPQSFSHVEAAGGEDIKTSQLCHATVAKPRVFAARWEILVKRVANSAPSNSPGIDKKRAAANRDGPLGNRIFLASVPSAEVRWQQRKQAGPANAQDRKQRRHFRHRHGDVADIVDLCARIRSAVTRRLGGELTRLQLIGAGYH